MNFDRLLELARRAAAAHSARAVQLSQPDPCRGLRRARARGRRGLQRVARHRPTSRRRSRARGAPRRRSARVHPARRADDASRADEGDRRARRRVRVPHQPSGRHGCARELAGRTAGDGQAAARRDDAAGVRRLWRLESRSTRRRWRESPTASSSAVRSCAPRARASSEPPSSRRRCAPRSTPPERGLPLDPRHDHARDHSARDALSRAGRHSAARAHDAAADRGRPHASTSRTRRTASA